MDQLNLHEGGDASLRRDVPRQKRPRARAAMCDIELSMSVWIFMCWRQTATLRPMNDRTTRISPCHAQRRPMIIFHVAATANIPARSPAQIHSSRRSQVIMRGFFSAHGLFSTKRNTDILLSKALARTRKIIIASSRRV